MKTFRHDFYVSLLGFLDHFSLLFIHLDTPLNHERCLYYSPIFKTKIFKKAGSAW